MPFAAKILAWLSLFDTKDARLETFELPPKLLSFLSPFAPESGEENSDDNPCEVKLDTLTKATIMAAQQPRGLYEPAKVSGKIQSNFE